MKKISSLKRGDVKAFVKENKQIQSLNVLTDESTLGRIDDLFQIRHLYVHNNGIVDQKFHNRTAGKYKLGEEHLMSVEELCQAAELLIGIVDQLTRSAISKYSLSAAK